MERILCAATWFDDGKKYHQMPVNIEQGLVVMALNHAMVYQIIGGSVKERHDLGIYEKQQGFVTNYRRFVDREEGLKIAIAANQIVKKHGIPDMLFSEDLFDFTK